jgi:hypothetical protein
VRPGADASAVTLRHPACCASAAAGDGARTMTSWSMSSASVSKPWSVKRSTACPGYRPDDVQRRRHLEHDDGRQGLLGRPCVVLVKCGRCRRVRPQTSKLVTAFEET